MADSELRPTHLPTDEHFARWAQRSRDQPLRMLSSACLTGLAVGYDGSDYGGYPAARALIDLAIMGAIAIPVWLFSPLWWSALLPLGIEALLIAVAITSLPFLRPPLRCLAVGRAGLLVRTLLQLPGEPGPEPALVDEALHAHVLDQICLLRDALSFLYIQC